MICSAGNSGPGLFIIGGSGLDGVPVKVITDATFALPGRVDCGARLILFGKFFYAGGLRLLSGVCKVTRIPEDDGADFTAKPMDFEFEIQHEIFPVRPGLKLLHVGFSRNAGEAILAGDTTPERRPVLGEGAIPFSSHGYFVQKIHACAEYSLGRLDV